ncbi:hypothetical protein [Virgibacillus kimchii]
MAAWLIFFSGFLFLALLTAIVSNFRHRLVPYAYTAIIISLAVPLINIVFIAGKPAELTGTSYLFQEFLSGNIWAVLIVSMYIYLAGWIILFIYGTYENSFRKLYNYVVEKGKELWMAVLDKTKESGRQNTVNKKQETGDK